MLDVTEEVEFQVCVELFNRSEILQRMVPIMLDLGYEGGKLLCTKHTHIPVVILNFQILMM